MTVADPKPRAAERDREAAHEREKAAWRQQAAVQAEQGAPVTVADPKPRAAERDREAAHEREKAAWRQQAAVQAEQGAPVTVADPKPRAAERDREAAHEREKAAWRQQAAVQAEQGAPVTVADPKPRAAERDREAAHEREKAAWRQQAAVQAEQGAPVTVADPKPRAAERDREAAHEREKAAWRQQAAVQAEQGAPVTVADPKPRAAERDREAAPAPGGSATSPADFDWMFDDQTELSDARTVSSLKAGNSPSGTPGGTPAGTPRGTPRNSVSEPPPLEVDPDLLETDGTSGLAHTHTPVSVRRRESVPKLSHEKIRSTVSNLLGTGTDKVDYRAIANYTNEHNKLVLAAALPPGGGGKTVQFWQVPGVGFLWLIAEEADEIVKPRFSDVTGDEDQDEDRQARMPVYAKGQIELSARSDNPLARAVITYSQGGDDATAGPALRQALFMLAPSRFAPPPAAPPRPATSARTEQKALVKGDSQGFARRCSARRESITEENRSVVAAVIQELRKAKAPPTVELDYWIFDERQVWFARTGEIPDLVRSALAASIPLKHETLSAAVPLLGPILRYSKDALEEAERLALKSWAKVLNVRIQRRRS
ncbi:hypothetical protein OHV05_37355 (plasmid) [Kitasatospora sp. NBC_00070]|uniref:hypothetical protein n=1 Tax=Kitasatospora sp. NBC_00070 TaxID=2975962 RepID=UPI00325567A9